MAHGACTFKQADVTRAVRAVERAGLRVARVELDGAANKITVVTKAEAAEAHHRPANELDEWMARHANSA
jgi:hypothetical protein